MIFILERKYTPLLIVAALVLLLFGIMIAFKMNQAAKVSAINSFDECVAAGYPVMESYPPRCMTPDKRSFTQEVSTFPTAIPEEEDVYCTMDAKQCPDGSSVGRVPPSCEFAPCPGE